MTQRRATAPHHRALGPQPEGPPRVLCLKFPREDVERLRAAVAHVQPEMPWAALEWAAGFGARLAAAVLLRDHARGADLSGAPRRLRDGRRPGQADLPRKRAAFEQDALRRIGRPCTCSAGLAADLDAPTEPPGGRRKKKGTQ